MNSWMITGAVAVAVVFSYVFTYVMRIAAPRLGLVDQPDNQRKLQESPISLGGGLAVYAAMVVTFLAVTLAATAFGPWLATTLSDQVPLLVCAGLLCLAGLWDDLRPMRSWHKLLLQIAACTPFLAFGQTISIVSFFDFQLDLGLASTPLTLFWLVACINAFNLIDGLDGFASSSGIIATATLGVLALLSGNVAIAMLSLITCGALVGFLFHNLPPARIYLGDAGSCSIGFLIGAVSVQASYKTAAVYLIVVPVVLLGIPFFDTFVAIARRKLSGRHFAAADREHFHHCLQDRGLSNRQALLALSSLSLMLALSAVLTFVYQNDLIAIGTLVTMASALVVFRIFGHREATMLISGMRSAATFRRKDQSAIAVENPDAIVIRLRGIDDDAPAPDRQRDDQAA
jgi:UDP-GlcNAc:undecaprenyl-phosphate GlcNAc-1-phosphate transferase